MTVVDQQRFVSQTVWDKNHDEETISAADLFRMRLDFAARGLANVQELIRFMDQKSGLVISAVGILTTAQGAFMLRALSSTPQTLLEITLPMLIITCALTYTLVAFSVVFAGMKVFTPSVAPRRAASQSPGFLFPLAVLAKNDGNEDIYHQKMVASQPSDLLLDYANQMIEISNVFEAKHRYLNIVFRRFRWLSFLWLLTMLLGAGATAFG